jgi:tetratricopeptide (TPR) repeat protein
MSPVLVQGSTRPQPDSLIPVNPLLEARRTLEAAEHLRQEGKLTQAQKLCEKVLREFPDYVGMLHTMGLVLADRHKYSEALPYLLQAAILNPKDWKTLTVLSGIYLRLGGREMAIRTLEQARALQPEDAYILATLGEIHREDREYENAAIAYRQALALDPSMHDIKASLANCCTHLGELEEAANALLTLRHHHPTSINLLFALCQLPAKLVNLDILSLLNNVAPDSGDDADTFKSSVAFTRSAALHDAGRHQDAWQALLEANRPLAARFRKPLNEDQRHHGDKKPKYPAGFAAFKRAAVIVHPRAVTFWQDDGGVHRRVNRRC